MTSPLLNENIWYDKYKYDDAERQYYEKLGRVTNCSDCSNNIIPSPLMHEKVWFDKFKFDDAEKRLHEHQADVARPSNKRVNNTQVQENAWCEKHKYDDAEKNYFEKLAKGVTNTSIKSSLASEIAKARQHIKHSLECVDGIASLATGANVDVLNRLNSVEKKNQDLIQEIGDMKALIHKLESQVNFLVSKSTATVATSPQPPAAAPAKIEVKEEDAEEEEEDVDLFGSDEEEEAERIREERLAEYAAKKAKKPAVIAKSSVLLDVKPWDDETSMEEMEKRVRTVTADGLVWGASKLVPLAYGIKKLQIMSVIEDEKVSVDWLQETIQEFEDHVQSVDIAAFNKI